MIDAGAKGAGVPDFFFSTPFWSGFFGMAMAALLGGVCFGFPASLFAGGNNRSLLVAIFIGALVAMSIGMTALLIRTMTPVETRAEGYERDRTLLGGVLAILIFVPAMWFAFPHVLNFMILLDQNAYRPFTTNT
ncbi:MAG: hypothetical protein KDD85_06420 [Parvularculaceae bacterium]|nr:hypothetical protein [Parvularculaceae bacterium]